MFCEAFLLLYVALGIIETRLRNKIYFVLDTTMR